MVGWRISQCGFTMVDMGNNAEITNVFHGANIVKKIQTKRNEPSVKYLFV